MIRNILSISLFLILIPITQSAPTLFDSGLKNSTKNSYRVYRIFPNTSEDFDSCVDIWKSAAKYHLNFWKEPSTVGTAIDVMVSPKYQSQFEELLVERKLDYVVTITDVQKLIEERERRHHADVQGSFEKLMRDDARDGSSNLLYDFQHYYPYEHMRIYMRQIEKAFPDMAKVYTIGFTHEGRPIEMLKMGYPLTKKGKKAIWIDAGIHAREWPSSTTAIYFMQQLATLYGKDPLITQYLNELNFYIVPLLNPDGYEYSRSSSDPEIRLWRKNRSPNSAACGSRSKCCMGVDLNRNFDFHWGETGASTDPCEEIYQGSSPFSEPEAKAVRDFIWSHRMDIQAVITMHTYSQIWIHPYGDRRNNYPPDHQELLETGQKAAAALKKMYGTEYKVGSGADTLYPASGGSDDWSKSQAGVKFVYLLELRPEDQVLDGFILEPRYLLPTGRETWEGIKVVINAVLKRLNIEPATGEQSKQSPPFSAMRTNRN